MPQQVTYLIKDLWKAPHTASLKGNCHDFTGDCPNTGEHRQHPSQQQRGRSQREKRAAKKKKKKHQKKKVITKKRSLDTEDINQLYL